MSDSNADKLERTDSPRKSGRTWMAIGIVASMLISSTLLIWAFSLPFRRLSASARPVATEGDNTVTALQRRDEAQEIRDAAIVQHRDFLFLLKKQKQLKLQQQLPGREESQKRWTRRTVAMKEKIVELDEAIKKLDVPEGSMLWQNREQLVKTIADSGE